MTNPRGEFPGQDRITILVLGRDYDRDRKGMPHTKHSRADTIMLISANLETKQLSAVSIPRDTFATGPDRISGKINGVLARGGPEMMIDTIHNEFNVRPDYYVLLKADAVQEIVDALGGVTVTALDSMDYDDNWGQLHIHLPAGRQTLDGEEAVGFSRFRQTSSKYRRGKRGPNLEEGDLRRTARQQQLVQAMVAAAKKPGNMLKADKIINVAFEQVETNLSKTQLMALAQMFKDSRDGMKSGTIPGEDKLVDGIYYYLPDGPRAKYMVAYLMFDDERSGKAMTRVAVYNASRVAGASRAAAAMLYAEGYDAFSAGNFKDSLEASDVIYRKSLYEGFASDVSMLLGQWPVKKDPGDPLKTWGPDVIVHIGAKEAEVVKERYGYLTK